MPEPVTEPRPQGGRIAENILYFARTLRAAGLPVGPGRVLEALNAVEAVGLGRRDDFYWTLHAVFVNRRDQQEVFDPAFHAFWRNPEISQRMMALRLPDITPLAGQRPDDAEARSLSPSDALRRRATAAREAAEQEEKQGIEAAPALTSKKTER